ncbi:ankyrin repeat domain-containing protein [Bradyrhizobium sp. 40]|uniref:ankyrin repeat domain-containing protein n=1 Tax=Bradyrhizobium sp. 40 TaxID=2782674 RepID=UPI001FFF0019|nr:ankyrin repeat domain-containing protein [Bradyrhizobium sp. 40]UPJ44961.1 ankyrin repeat domain-containing protein [Bradyrhizobium sp. 40]
MAHFEKQSFTTYLNVRGQNYLHILAHQGDDLPIRSLAAMGVDPNKADIDGATPLHYAALAGHGVVIHELVAAGADVTLLTKCGRSAADVARLGGHTALALSLDEKIQKTAQLANRPVPRP